MLRLRLWREEIDPLVQSEFEKVAGLRWVAILLKRQGVSTITPKKLVSSSTDRSTAF